MSPSSSARLCAAVVGLAVLATAAATAAQQPGPVPSRLQPEAPPAEAVVSGVEVTAPKTIERSRYGVLTQEISMSVRVPYGDLDMASPGGVAELDRRVAEAADYACRQLTRMYPAGTPEEFYCAREAVRDAQPQVRLARVAN